MDHESILRRKADLEEQRQAALDQLNAVMGALQDCDYWLAQLAKEEPPAVPEESRGHLPDS